MVFDNINVLHFFMLFTSVKHCSCQILYQDFLLRTFELHLSLKLAISYEFYIASLVIDPQ